MPVYNHPGTISTRTRKNVKNMSLDEWSRFVDALRALKSRSRPGGVVSIYDEFSALHMGTVEMHRAWKRTHPDSQGLGNGDPAHDNPGFLSWHRQMLLEFESALQSVDPAIMLPYWDWTDRESTRKLFTPEMAGGNGGHDGEGGAVVKGPFTLLEGWNVTPAFHRPSWFRTKTSNLESKPVESDSEMQVSLGRSLVRYMGEIEDLATPEDVIEFTKRKIAFGPERLVKRTDIIKPDDKILASPSSRTTKCQDDPKPRGTLHIEESFSKTNASPLTTLINCTMGSSYDVCDNPLTGENVHVASREDNPGFRWSLEAGPHMHNQTHDWFGFHTTIIQDDQIIGATTMANVACAATDPIFFLHHCNIDRLWAEWQDSGHYGSIFFPKRDDPLMLYENIDAIKQGVPVGQYKYPDGHNLDDYMWPWDKEALITQPELQSILPYFPYSVTARDVLDYRLLGYIYDTSRRLDVNSVTPVIVHLPSVVGVKSRQVFPLLIQREARYLIAAKNCGVNQALLKITLHKEYEEMWEYSFIEAGFQSKSIPSEHANKGSKAFTGLVWRLPRGMYYVVVEAMVPAAQHDIAAAINAVYEIGVGTSMDFHLPHVPIAPGVISDPQVPAESCIYLANHRYPPVLLEDGLTQLRLTQMKGAHELFGINVSNGPGFAEVRFEGMDALVQLYGPFDLDGEQLPHFDTDGRPIEGDTRMRLNARLQIASSEGCCKRLGSGISSFVSPGRYIILVFHCSIGHNEHQPYKVTYTFDPNRKVRELELGQVDTVDPVGHGRSVNLLYRVVGRNGFPLLTKRSNVYRIRVVTDDEVTGKQVRVAVFAYSSRDILESRTCERMSTKEKKQYVSYDQAYFGGSELSFDVLENQILFVRVCILNGFKSSRVRTVIKT